MKRYKVSVFLQLEEYDIGTTHKHKVTGRVLEFGDSKTDAFREYDHLEKEILKLLEGKYREKE